MAGWGGRVADLEKAIEEKLLCPGSVFGVVAKGFYEYRRPPGVAANDESDSLSPFSKVLDEGSKVCARASEIDGQTLIQQMRDYVVAHGGSFDEGIDWPTFIRDRAKALNAKAEYVAGN